MKPNHPTAIQVEELVRHVGDAHRARQEQCRSLISHLAPRLQAVGTRERALDRQTARRFNAFKYLREDELGLSLMIADLLNPTAEHCQGTSFLQAMLDTLPETSGRFGALRTTVTSPITVLTERRIPTGGRIDITVDIPLGAKSFCLAFENKPYAHDLSGQLRAYLEYLRHEYGTQFLLVYLPPVDREPDEVSLSATDRESWRAHSRIMPYVGGDRSLEDWFAACGRCCAAEPLRWFLKSAELFCKERFGGSTMKTDAEARFVHDYLSTNPSHLRAALAVHDAWSLVREEVCERFLKHLRQIVEDRLRKAVPDIDADFYVRCRYEGNRRNSNCLWIARDGWIRYDDLAPNVDGRSTIRLESEGPGPNAWSWGVQSPKSASAMTGEEKIRREQLEVTLRNHGLLLSGTSDWWPQWESLRRYSDWNPLVPELYDECEARGGPITNYYADKLLDIAACAIPAINEVERSKSNPKH